MMEKFIPGLGKLRKNSLHFSLLLLLNSIVLASIPVTNNPILGGIAVVDFTTQHPNPKAFYNKIPLYVQPIKDQHWQVLIGIPLQEKPGKKTLIVEDFSTQRFYFEVIDYNYDEQHITLKNDKKKYLNPNLQHLDRINKERLILSEARKTFSKPALSKGHFIRPVKGITTSPFGLRRFYNGQARRAHTGLDYAGDMNTPILSAADGKVLLTGHFFFNGKTVFIDHGQGLISVYIHMNKIAVKQNQMIKQGEIIGTVGQTGRTTGAHLHWGVYLNQVSVNPNLLLKKNEI